MVCITGVADERASSCRESAPFGDEWETISGESSGIREGSNG